MNQRMTRLAPSPTGALHLGNARTFLVNWLWARQNSCSLLLRIEDLDGPRVKRGADADAMEDLSWLGLDWDLGPIYQSRRLSLYRDAIDYLLINGDVYPCICSRSESQSAASAPHAEDGSHRYPGTCRGKFKSIEHARTAGGKEPAIRFRVPNETVNFIDEFAGKMEFNVDRLGDFVIAKADGTPAYQLAVVIDDAEMHITDIVRGNDLIESTARQILLYRALGLETSIPRYIHLPLVVGYDGRRLAKRHGDSRLSNYRAMGIRPERVLALLARWCGLDDIASSVTAKELLARFHLSQLPHGAIIFTQEDEAFLMAGRSQ